MFVVAAEAAALYGAAPRVATEIEAAADFLSGAREGLQARAAELAPALEGAIPIVYGAGLTAPVARRWKTQVNENAKLPAFFSSLPEADHNEICGWAGVPEGARMVVVMLEDHEEHPRVRRRFELTAEEISAAGTEVVRVDNEGDGPVSRMLWSTMLGDLVSLRLAELRGVDPLDVSALESLKTALGQS